MQVVLNPKSIEDYRKFLKIKSLPHYSICGRMATFPDEYAGLVGVSAKEHSSTEYTPPEWMFDYQRYISSLAIARRKFSMFVDCGYGKSACMFEFVKAAQSDLGNRRGSLIITPLMVVRQMVQEARKFYGDNLPIEVVKAADLQKWLSGCGGKIGITNYDALTDDLQPGKLGCLCIDECFAAGTLVDVVDCDGSISPTPIELVEVGDSVFGADGPQKVIARKKNEVPYAIVIRAGQDITCSPNHPFFTQRGWVCAQDIEPGDSILSSVAAMRMVREGVFPEGYQRAGKILRQVLLSELENESADPSCESTYSSSASQKGSGEGSVACVGRSESKVGTCPDYKPESSVRPCLQEEAFGDAHSHEPRTFRAWWQREGIDGTAEDFAGCFGAELDGGVCVIAGPLDAGISHKLQARLGKYRDASVYRSGWSLAQIEEVVGCEKGCEAGFVRVESLEVLELGDSRLEQFRDEDGKLYFYDLEAERHPSYSVGGLLVHNSSMLKSHYGKWGTTILRLGKGLEWKLAGTGTPAPNDRIEYANHAVFMDAFTTVNAFLATYFINRGQTQNRWEIKPHALKPFYKALSHWSIFLTNPATYGFKDNCGTIPPINVHIHRVDLTDDQIQAIGNKSGQLFVTNMGGITTRGAMGQIAKGNYKGKAIDTLKPQFIADLIASEPDRSTIVWCLYDAEQEKVMNAIPGSASIDGQTKTEKRIEIIEAFQRGEIKTLISKPKIMGFGLNLQVCTRMVFSGLQDSYEQYHQAVKRANRVGSTMPLDVHIPVTEIEEPMIETVLSKAKRIQSDTEFQEQLFRSVMMGASNE